MAAIPAVALIFAAVLIEVRLRKIDRLDDLATRAHHTAEVVDQRLQKLLDLVGVCASSPSLVVRLDLEDFADNCGHFAGRQGGRFVLIALGETHQQILDTGAADTEAPPAYPREKEEPALLELEARSKESGTAVIADVIETGVSRYGIIGAGQHVVLADGRPAMLYVYVDVRSISRLLATLSRSSGSVHALLDPSHRIVARSLHIDRYMFAAAPAWLDEARRNRQPGAELDVSGPTEIGGQWDAGYHPLRVAPGWMAMAVEPRSGSIWPLPMNLQPIVLAVLGLLLSGLSYWNQSHSDRAAARLAEVDRARAEAERSNREKSRLLASLAHDIRSPLVSMLGSLELSAEREDPGGPETRNARRSAEALLQLLDDILEFSYLGSGEVRLAPSPVDLQDLAEELIERFDSPAKGKGLALHLDAETRPLPTVSVDRHRLARVLDNLLSNAIKYTEDGKVTLRITAGEPRSDGIDVTFAVSDTGAGIAPEDVPEVLREFGRLERDVASGAPGTGLGLAICQRILKSMGAKLSIESAQGEGSVFSFTMRLPVATGEDARVDVEPLAGLVVLYAEDEPVTREVTTRRLSAAGAKVVEAQDGAELLEKLASVSPDLILLDLKMPKLDGLATIRHLRATTPQLHCPVFVLTCDISGPRSDEARADGADEVFAKPLQIPPLATAVQARGGDRSPPPRPIGSRPVIAEMPLIDETTFCAVAEAEDETVGNSLVSRCRVSLEADVADLATLVAGGRKEEAIEVAHRSRGLCEVLGATRLAGHLQCLETALAGQGSGRSDAQIAEIQQTLGATLAVMMQLVSDPSDGRRAATG